MTAKRARKIILFVLVLAAAYALVAYLLLPALWTHHEHQPGLAQRPMVTRTAQGISGDPLNAGLVGSREDIIKAMHAAGWYPADPVTLKSSLEIIGSVLLDRAYTHAPVSPLYYESRVEDMAFEKPDGRSADRRHHVRFWRVLDKGVEGRPVFLGAASFDRGVGLSHYTGQVTHHIAADIDAARDALLGDLEKARLAEAIYTVSGSGPTLNGRNGGGDRYWTDGEIRIARLTQDAKPAQAAPQVFDAPQAVQWKDALMKQLGPAIGQ